jgi:hypothetical protein
VKRHGPATKAVILPETRSAFQVLILSQQGWNYVGELDFVPPGERSH